MNAADALNLAEEFVGDFAVVVADTIREWEVGFYFKMNYRKDERWGSPFGLGGLLVDRNIPKVHILPSGPGINVDYWFEACRRGLHRRLMLIVTKVHDRRRAAEALLRLEMRYVKPEVAYGETWVIPQSFTREDFQKAFDDLPAKFEDVYLGLQLREIERIESENDLGIELVSMAT